MKIYIMRHGEAGYSASSDAKRLLTDHGQRQCQQIANLFNEQNITFDLGLASPYLRAQQTLSLIAQSVAIATIETKDNLVPGGSAAHVADSLMMLPLTGISSVLIVSHLPLVGYLVNELCSQVSPPMFSTAEVACISLSQEGEGTVEWFHHLI